MARFIEEKSGETYEFDKDQVLIGRPSHDLSIQHDIPLQNSLVSRRHAIIHRKGDEFELENLSITNGTEVNNVRINFCLLKDGDKISIGDTVFVFERGDSPEDEKRPTQVPAKESGGREIEECPAAIEQPVNSATKEVRFAEDEQGNIEVFEKVDGAELRPDSQLFKETLLKGGDSDYVEKIQSLFRITNDLNATSEESELYEKAIESLQDFMPMDRCAILIENHETKNLEPICTFRKDLEEDEEGLFVSRGVVEEVLEKRVGFLASDVSTDEKLRVRVSVFLKRIKSAMCAPLELDGQVIGVCYVDSTSIHTHYDQTDLLCLGIFCNLLTRAILNARTTKEAERQMILTQNLERYFSPKLVGELAKGGGLDLGGKEVEVSVLFTDIRKFSSIAKMFSPQELIEILNEHFSLVVDIIMEFEGTIDKYIGDSVMAFWGAPVAVEHAPTRCVLAAIEIQRQMRKWQEDKRLQGLDKPFSIGVGINTGTALAGNIGSPKRMDYTIVSDAVNMAERLCSLAEPDQVLISEAAYEKVKDLVSVNELPPREVKGGYKLSSFEVIW
jgi:adenylate cyclase